LEAAEEAQHAANEAAEQIAREKASALRWVGYDFQPPKFNGRSSHFRLQNWYEVKHLQLPGSCSSEVAPGAPVPTQAIVGLNPPYGRDNCDAKSFIQHACGLEVAEPRVLQQIERTKSGGEEGELNEEEGIDVEVGQEAASGGGGSRRSCRRDSWRGRDRERESGGKAKQRARAHAQRARLLCLLVPPAVNAMMRTDKKLKNVYKLIYHDRTECNFYVPGEHSSAPPVKPKNQYKPEFFIYEHVSQSLNLRQQARSRIVSTRTARQQRHGNGEVQDAHRQPAPPRNNGNGKGVVDLVN
jgi:hypothetical protein